MLYWSDTNDGDLVSEFNSELERPECLGLSSAGGEVRCERLTVKGSKSRFVHDFCALAVSGD